MYYRYFVAIFIGCVSIFYYLVVIASIYEFFSIVITGIPDHGFSIGFWNMLGFPLIVIILIYVLRLKDSPVLYPAFKLSLFMIWATQISLFIVRKGFVDGSLVQQSVFLILGLVGFILARWGICHYFYQKYEANKGL